MPNFQYVALDKDGLEFRGVKEVETKEQLAAELQGEGLYLSSCHVLEDVPDPYQTPVQAPDENSLLGADVQKLPRVFTVVLFGAIVVLTVLVGYYFSPWKPATRPHSHFVREDQHAEP